MTACLVIRVVEISTSGPLSKRGSLTKSRQLERGGNTQMTALLTGIWKLKIWNDTRGQDLVEYALLAGFMVSVAAVFSPAVSGSISTVFSSVGVSLGDAGAQAPSSGHM
jgi:pilus assembly protein Flp/PilA